MFDRTILVVDLDGTLIHTDLLHESSLLLLKANPLNFFSLIWRLLVSGRAGLKRWLSDRVKLEVTSLPYNYELVAWLKEQYLVGKTIVLCTASDAKFAHAVSNYLGFFDEVISSNGVLNLSGKNKAKILVDKFGFRGFDYAGNSNPDLEVWRCARKAILVNASARLIRDARLISDIQMVFERINSNLINWCNAFRIYQWLKNFLLFVPLVAAHRLTDWDSWISLLIAFFAFNLCASSVYIINDLVDLDSDRQHPRKCNRPFANGALPIYLGVVAAPILLLISFILGYFVSSLFLQWLLTYFLITFIYSLKLKQLVLLDCMTLAILYTLRILAGSSVVGGLMSFWLLAFSIFLFLSLAFVKRYAELQLQLLGGIHKVRGRGYLTDDAPLIQMLGIASGFMAVLIFALYLYSPEVQLLYQQPQWVWGNIPVLVFWISWLWLQAHRGEMHDDPLIFAIKDKASLISGLLFVCFLLLGSLVA